jgi:phospholipid/cholesterol/gamma-HCH transport system substrate-binding protein
MRTLEGSDRIRNGLIGLLVLIMVIGVGQSFVSTPMLFAKPIYYAHFADSAGSGPGDKVRINGVDVGMLKSMLDLDTILLGFGLDDDRVHSPNEKFELECFRLGMRSHAHLIDELSRL